MDDPVTRRLLPYPLLHQRLLAAEQLHGELVVCRLEQRLELVLDEALLSRVGHTHRGVAHGRGPRLLLGGTVQAELVGPEVDLAAGRGRREHVSVGQQEGLVIERRHQRVCARVGVLDADLDALILCLVRQPRRADLLH